MARRGAALALLLLLAPCVLGQGAGAAKPASGGTASCTDAPPSPPTGLRATAGDGVVQLAWGPPASGCTVSYQVTVIPADGAPLPRTETSALSAAIRGLANGVQHKVGGW